MSNLLLRLAWVAVISGFADGATKLPRSYEGAVDRDAEGAGSEEVWAGLGAGLRD